MAQDDQIRTDPVFIGLTRPAMFLGLPYAFAVLLFFTTVIVFIATASFWAYLIGVPLYLAGRALAAREPRFIDLYLKRFLRTPPLANHRFWGGVNSYEP